LVRGARHRKAETKDEAVAGLISQWRLNAETSGLFCASTMAIPRISRRVRCQILPDAVAKKDGLVRVIDESAEDYLYPMSYFVPLDLPSEAKKALLA
jgi:hypothetical protein